jgi:hypothetical protein
MVAVTSTVLLLSADGTVSIKGDFVIGIAATLLGCGAASADNPDQGSRRPT